MSADSTTGIQLRPRTDVQIGAKSNEKTVAITLAAIVNSAYGYRRVSESEMLHRISTTRNRVLHIARVDGKIVGCCSKATSDPDGGKKYAPLVDEAPKDSTPKSMSPITPFSATVC